MEIMDPNSSESVSSDNSAMIFGCFAHTKEPLAIHFLQKIIHIEAYLIQLEHTIDILIQNKDCNGPKFPQIIQECQDQLDFISKLDYLSFLIEENNREFLKNKQLCELN